VIAVAVMFVFQGLQCRTAAWERKVKVQSQVAEKNLLRHCFERARLEPCRKRNQISVGFSP